MKDYKISKIRVKGKEPLHFDAPPPYGSVLPPWKYKATSVNVGEHTHASGAYSTDLHRELSDLAKELATFSLDIFKFVPDNDDIGITVETNRIMQKGIISDEEIFKLAHLVLRYQVNMIM